MILYVLAVWLCAVGCVALIELFVLSIPHPARTTFQTLDDSLKGLPGLPAQPPDQASYLILGLSLLLMGVICGYILEWQLRPAQRLYRSLQKSYPDWYRRLPAVWREVWLAIGLGLVILLPALGLALLSKGTRWEPLPFTFGLGLGLLVLPLLRYRRLLNEDRPETAPQAVLHKVIPDYSLERALALGQVYLRLLLPVFSLFCMLVLPLALNQLSLGPVETGLLLLGLFSGAALGWLSHRDSQLDFSSFRRNLYQLCSLSLLASAFLIFGVASGNLVEMLFLSAFSGYLVGLY